VSKDHSFIFNPSHGVYKSPLVLAWSEQTQVNYNIKKFKIPIYDIGYKFNHMEGKGLETRKLSNLKAHRFHSSFIHYAGVSFQDEKNNCKALAMRRDLSTIRGIKLF